MERKRTDAERRARQCERLSRLLRILKLISGPGRWDADGLAGELECSRRTIYRDLQTLSMAGVPWHYDENAKAYRVLPGFKFPGLSGDHAHEASLVRVPQLLTSIRTLVEASEAFLETLRAFCGSIESDQSPVGKSISRPSSKTSDP